MITKFHVENFGSLRNVSVDLAPFTVLVGPNDAGKSMLMRALQVWGVATKQTNWTIPNFKELSWMGCQEDIRFDAEMAVGGVSVVCQEVVDVPNYGVKVQKMGTSQDNLSGFTDECKQFLKGVRRYVLRPEHLVNPRSESRSAGRFPEPESLYLPEVWADLMLANTGTSQCVEALLKEMFPFVRGIQVKRAKQQGGPDAFSLHFRLRDDVLVPASLSSDGLRAMLAHLTLLFGDEPPTVLMIEEPESGLHPGLMGKLVELFERASRGDDGARAVQIIVATQSPDFLNFVSEDSIRVVWRDQDTGETSVRPFSDAPKLKELLAYQGPGEIWANMGDAYLAGEKP